MANINQIAKQVANMIGANQVYKGPLFTEVLPFYKAWGQMLPAAQQEAQSMINPFIQRELGQQMQQFQQGLARTGGGRFGQALGGGGAIEAEMERQRRAQMLDWINQRRQGFEELFYNPAQEAWTQAIELGKKKPKIPKIPTWNQFTKQYGI